jgi:predicted NodU family carbamoyl transferase
LDHVVFYEKPLVKFERILQTTLNTFPRSMNFWRDSMNAWLKEKLFIKSIIRDRVGVKAQNILFCDHHMSHAASAFFASPFHEAAVLTVHGVGRMDNHNHRHSDQSLGGGNSRAKTALSCLLNSDSPIHSVYSIPPLPLGWVSASTTATYKAMA